MRGGGYPSDCQSSDSRRAAAGSRITVTEYAAGLYTQPDGVTVEFLDRFGKTRIDAGTVA